MPVPFDPQRVRRAYDATAPAYAATFGDELDHLPLDAALVDRLVSAADGPILECGAGVGPLARRAPLAHVVAVDLSAEMLARTPATAGRVQADLERLPFCDTAFGAAIARYVLQHIARAQLPAVLAEVRRVLRPGGLLLVAVHLGEGEIELTELLGARFEAIGGAYHSRKEIRTLLTISNFEPLEEHERGPVAGEADSQRLYVLARAVTPSAGRTSGRCSPPS
jgi:SAM-dependent methyltransferase